MAGHCSSFSLTVKKMAPAPISLNLRVFIG
ncbi:hypothetical protein V6Z11_D11G200600 [Gossypium hirsutum]